MAVGLGVGVGSELLELLELLLELLLSQLIKPYKSWSVLVDHLIDAVNAILAPKSPEISVKLAPIRLFETSPRLESWIIGLLSLFHSKLLILLIGILPPVNSLLSSGSPDTGLSNKSQLTKRLPSVQWINKSSSSKVLL